MKKILLSFILYNLIGLSGVGLDLLLFSTLSAITTIDYRVINVFSVLLGITNNFYWNLRYNFRSEDYYLKRYFSFLSVGLFGLLISTLSLTYLVDSSGLSQIRAKVITIFFVAIIQFGLNKFLTFRR